MGARTDKPAGRTPARIEREIGNFVQARQVAEDHGQPDIAVLLDQAAELARTELDAKNT
ncbi:hypothetical protein OG323_06250 [Streptomyces cyaneofuscatus]|uniref:hypothetical protein n=1 Tax=Streptomyces cyaneofuscatus TaxID=66883 RepID=UPI0038680E12|nr:hypothetical protein OG323_06250 [Streptomyces cyaneofuscatus]